MPRSVIRVEQLPMFLSNLDGPATEWQLGIAFAPKKLASVPGMPLPVVLQLKNTMPQAVSGTVRIRGPRNWWIEPQAAEFRLDAGTAWKLPLEVTLPNDVVGGPQPIALEFEMQAGRLYHFAVYRQVEVTLGDVALDGTANSTGTAAWKSGRRWKTRANGRLASAAHLLAPDRRRQSMDVFLQPQCEERSHLSLAGRPRIVGQVSLAAGRGD